MNRRRAETPAMPLRSQAGSSLIEVLVSLLLLSFGLLAMVTIQAHAVVATKTANYRGTATILASELADLVRANPAAFIAGQYEVSDYLPDAAPVEFDHVEQTVCAYPACTFEAIAAHDLASIKYRVRSVLPRGGVQLQRAIVGGVPSASEADLWIVWLEPQVFAQGSAKGAEEAAEANFDHCPPQALKLERLPRCLYLRISI